MLVDIRKVRSYVMNRILIIDDDKELCMLIKRSVCAENIEADICNTGREGIQQLKEQEYQLVILDVMMPGMDGFETLEEIRKEYSLPILMFTAKNDSASKVKGLRAGADDYLTKPFNMDELIARIVSLIRRYTRFNQQEDMGKYYLHCETKYIGDYNYSFKCFNCWRFIMDSIIFLSYTYIICLVYFGFSICIANNVDWNFIKESKQNILIMNGRCL